MPPGSDMGKESLAVLKAHGEPSLAIMVSKAREAGGMEKELE